MKDTNNETEYLMEDKFVDVEKKYKGKVISKMELPLTSFDIPMKEFQDVNKDNNNIEALYSKFYKYTLKNTSKNPPKLIIRNASGRNLIRKRAGSKVQRK